QLPLAAIQVKHFAQAEGLGRTQEFLNYFYDGLMSYMPKTKVAAQVLGEEAAVAEADAANAVVVEGTLLEVKKKGLVGIVRADVGLYRVSDHKLVKQFIAEVPYKPSPLNKDKNIAEPAGGRLAYMIQKELKKLKGS
ncbi:MAG TPA: hypothetical protein VKT17_09455, partial [Acidobacteriota bacterium]|nr:hypothetical protein [Acidobacteriota bacterium]